MDKFPCTCIDWEATSVPNPQAPEISELKLKGALLCPTPGYVITVGEPDHQSDPQNWVFELSAEAPTGPVDQTPTRAEFSFTVEGWYTDFPESVTLQPGCGSKKVR